MLHRKSRGTRRSCVIIGLLVLIVVMAVAGLWVGRYRTAHRRQFGELAREATAAVEQRAAAVEKQLETARANLPADAPIPRDWSIGKTAEFCRHLEATDLKLMREILRALSTPDPEQRLRDYDAVRAHVQIANTPNATTKFEQDIAQCVDSPQEMLRIAHDYLAAFAPLRESEQALAVGLFVIPANDTSVWNMPGHMSALLALRAMGELQDGDTRRALQSLLHAYALGRTLADENFDGYAWPCCWAPDRVLQPAMAPLWNDSPLTDEERATLVAAAEWRPSRDQLIQRIYALAAKEPEELMGVPPAGESDVERLWASVRKPFRAQGLYETIRQLEPLMGRPPYEVEARFEAVAKKVSRFADFTAQILNAASSLNQDYARRAEMGDFLRIVFALEDHRKKHGEYPAKLEGQTGESWPPVPRHAYFGSYYEYASDGRTFSFRIGGTTSMAGRVVWRSGE